MNKTIEFIKELIEKNKIELQENESILATEFNKILDDMSLIKEIAIKVENSKEYTKNEFDGWPCQFVYIDDVVPLELRQTEIFPYLCDYIQEHFYVYTENLGTQSECFILNCGPSIIINHKGDILDQETDKWIIDNSAYRTDILRNKLIENYMEKTGCFPGVFLEDYYGNLTPISTVLKGGKE